MQYFVFHWDKNQIYIFSSHILSLLANIKRNPTETPLPPDHHGFPNAEQLHSSDNIHMHRRGSHFLQNKTYVNILVTMTTRDPVPSTEQLNKLWKISLLSSAGCRGYGTQTRYIFRIFTSACVITYLPSSKLGAWHSTHNTHGSDISRAI